MKICGVICELNPFHNGHEYIFHEAKKVTGSDYLIAVMSGDFVQRGMPAICDKYSRTRMALMGGADLVLELPTVYSTASADYFAYGAVSALNNLRCVDFLCFGSENGDVCTLQKYVRNNYFDDEAHILSQGIKHEELKEQKKNGLSHSKAMSNISGQSLSSNDMLGVCYIKSLKMLNSDMEPVAIKRIGSGYLDSGESDNSATAIRSRIYKQSDFSEFVPWYVSRILDDIQYDYFPVNINDFSLQLCTGINNVIRNEERNLERLTDYMDVSANIAGRIRSHIGSFRSYEAFINDIHTKEYTKSRVMRALLHVLLDIRKSDYDSELNNCITPYARILGFRKTSVDLMGLIKEQSIVPIISKASDAQRILDDEAFKIYKTDIYASNIYEQAASYKFGNYPVHEYSKNIVLV